MRWVKLLAPLVLLAALAGVFRSAGESPEGRPPDVILLVLDEFPGDSLLDARGRIDQVRYPNLARLAADGTWFPNAHSSYDSTTKAVPLILDGRAPVRGSFPDRRSHPRTIFDAFARAGYETLSFEEATAICPPRLCRGGRSRRPAIIPRLNGGREERFARFVRSIRPGRRPTLWVKHALLPHGPYLFLPSAARARRGPRDLVPGMNSVAGFGDEFLTRHNEQRYLLQAQFADRLVGRVLRRLEKQGMYHDAVVVVTADHGFAWQVGVDSRRSVSASNVEEVAPVPLIVKPAGRASNRIDRSYARTLDVTPTVADVAGVRLGYRTAGRSAFSRAVRRRRTVSLITRDFSTRVTISGRRWRARRRAVVRRRLRQFGSGTTGLYAGIGPNRLLVGREVAGLARDERGRVRAILAAAGELRRVRRSSGVVPAQIAGRIEGGAPGERRELAISVNGRIEAVGRSFHLIGQAPEFFAVMVPEASLEEGANSVEVFEVLRGPRLQSIARY